MKRAALVPVRSFARAKLRLRARFSPQDVDAIQRALLADVLAALHAARKTPPRDRVRPTAQRQLRQVDAVKEAIAMRLLRRA